MSQPALNREIVLELYRSLVLLGAQSDLLSTVGSWGDSLPDDTVLSDIKAWNAGQLKEVSGRIEHYEISRPRPVDSHFETGQPVHQEPSQP